MSLIDKFLSEADAALRTLLPPKQRECDRNNPAGTLPETTLTSSDKKHIAGLMRVNHAGEVCAQALYRGQATTAKLETTRDQMTHAALEEIDHLAWCEARLQELHHHTSILNPVWYASSWCIGAFAGLIGDQWSLGFVAETEKQVTAHLESHLRLLPKTDQRTKAILLQMKIDEIAHAEMAEDAGAATLPPLIQRIMCAISKVMTKSSYHL